MHVCAITEDVVRGLDVDLEDNQPGILVGEQKVPVSQGAVMSLMWGNTLTLQEAELDAAGCIQPKEKNRVRIPSDREALVRISFAPGVGGFSEVTQASFDLVERSGRIFRRYHPLDPQGSCVRLLAQSMYRSGDVAWPEYLLRVRPSDAPSIRCYRTGSTEGAPREVEYAWDGGSWRKYVQRVPRACLR